MMKLILTAVLLFAASCTSGDQYSVVIKNSTGQLIREAAVVYGDFRSVGGSMSSGVTATHRFVQAPLPAHATVEWQTLDKVLHSKKVVVRPLLPANFTGDIFFEIGPGEQVRVWADTAGDRERRAWMDSAK
jgi:hypothetical protein